MTGRLDMSLANDVQEVARVIDSLEEFGAANGIPPNSRCASAWRSTS